MNKIKMSLISAVLVVLTALTAASSAGSASDPLISLSYLNGEYRTALKTELEEHITKAYNSVYDRALTKIDSGRALVPQADGYVHAEKYAALTVYPGQKLTLSQGTGFTLTTGSPAVAVSGVMLDLTDGQAANAITAKRRYFVAEDSSVTLTSGQSFTLQIDGYYLLEGELRTHHEVFTDVAIDKWYYDAVDYAYANGLFAGTSATTFSPELSMTRGMFVTVLYRLSGAANADAPVITDFPDVMDSAVYYYAPVRWAASNDIVRGYDDGTFKPNEPITREQMAAIMYRYAYWLGENLAFPEGTGESFPDYASVSSYARDPMRWAVYMKIINGSDGKLLPGDTATRAQVAQIIMNFAKR